MATQDAGMTKTTRTPDMLLGGGHPPVQMTGVLLADTTSAVRGLVCMLIDDEGPDDGKFTAWVPGGNGHTMPSRILANGCNVVGSDSPARFYVHGEFNRDALNWGDATDAQIAAAIIMLRVLGIYIQEVL